MSLVLKRKSCENNVYVLIKDEKKLKGLDKKIERYVDKLKFKKDENFVCKMICDVDKKWELIYNLVTVVKNSNSLEDKIEEIIENIGNSIISTNKIFGLDISHLEKNIEELFVELLWIKLYSMEDYKTKKKNKYCVYLNTKIAKKDEKSNLISNIYLTRNLVNMTAWDLNPTSFLKKIKEMFKKNKQITIKVIKWNDLQKKWLNWIYEVGKGSEHEPNMIAMEYKPQKWDNFVGLIGKWVTFDSWWYNIKPTWYMEDMKSDMWWAATVLWVFSHLVETWFKKNIILTLGIVENLVSSNAFKPWDIIKMYNGKTVEVWNTDAEWRLVLADCLSYTEKHYKPKYMFDMATLTGAQIVALWTQIAAILWQNKKLLSQIQTISWDIKERTWELPYHKPYFKSYKSQLADMNNISWSRMWPWTITAGLFLWEFVKTKNWVHFDIAWPAWIFSGKMPIWWQGWSGFWVRLLTKLLKELK